MSIRTPVELFADQGPRDGDKKAGSSSEATKLKQVTLSGVIAKSAPYPRDSCNVEATIGFVYHSLQPISIVDESSRHLLEIEEPRFQLPHRTHFTEKVLPNK